MKYLARLEGKLPYLSEESEKSQVMHAVVKEEDLEMQDSPINSLGFTVLDERINLGNIQGTG